MFPFWRDYNSEAIYHEAQRNTGLIPYLARPTVKAHHGQWEVGSYPVKPTVLL